MFSNFFYLVYFLDEAVAMMMRFIFFAWALILGVVSADDAFTYPPAGGVSSDVTWTIGQLVSCDCTALYVTSLPIVHTKRSIQVTANWTTTKTFANLYLWPASNADVHSIYIVGRTPPPSCMTRPLLAGPPVANARVLFLQRV